MRIRFLLFSIERANKVNRQFVWVGKRLARIFFKVRYDLEKAGLEVSAEKYLTASVFSALVYGILFFSLFFLIFFAKEGGAITALNSVMAFVIGFAFFAVFFLLHIIYPSIMAKKYSTEIDQSLMFALKNMLVQVSSGVSLFDSLVNISKTRFGSVSMEFKEVVQNISAGESEAMALEKLAIKTKSDYLRRTCWQLLTSLRSGASLEGALKSVVQTLSSHQTRAIKNYASELNMWILMYLLLAAAIPTLGITFLVILSAMGGSSIGPEVIALQTLPAQPVQ